MKQKALMVVLLVVAAALHAQWHYDSVEDMMAGTTSQVMVLGAEAAQGTLNPPALFVRTSDGSEYDVFVHWGGYTIWEDNPRLIIRYGENEPLQWGASLSTNKNSTFLPREGKVLEYFSELSDGGKVVMQVERSSGNMTARWDMTGFDEAFTELQARAAGTAEP